MRDTMGWLRVLAAVVGAAVTTTTVSAAEPQPGGAGRAGKSPNVIVILTDDQGWGDLSLHGNRNLKTPHIDSIGLKGARFDRFFVQPVCSPTRAEFLTGRYHPRGGVRDVSTGGERLNLNESTIADAYRSAGYATACFGKWHNGTQFPYHPLGRGFQEYYGFTSGHWGDYFSAPLDHNGKEVAGKGFLADDLTDRTIDFVKKHADRPFFCYLAYNTPHSPMQVPDAYWKRFQSAELPLKGGPGGKEDLNHTRAALAMCENLDDNIGRLLKAIDEEKLAERTIVVYFHDNGPNGGRWNGGMKGRKGTLDEGGVRSPLLIRWTDTIAAGTEIQPIAGAIDLMPTLLGLCGVKRAGDPIARPLDGMSFESMLLGRPVERIQRTLFQTWNNRVSVRTQTERLDPDGRLFDMVADPGQTKDISAERPERTAELKKAADGFRKDVIGNLTKKDDRPFLVGDPSHAVTNLPARDGVPHGGVARSARAPNCSYFTNWTRTDDRITWNVAVRAAGNYRLEILYACPQADLGSEVEFRLGDARVSAKVSVAHDPKARGNENDRVPRVGESLVKDFRSMTVGEVRLAEGAGEIALQAKSVAGKQVMEVRGLRLTRLP